MFDDEGGELLVQTPLANIRTSTNGVLNLDDWLHYDDKRKWDVITFNVGLHDLRTGTSLTAYERNLRNIAKRILAYGAIPIFLTTTHDPNNEPGREELNAIARKVMRELNIGVYDLGKFSLSQIPMHVNPLNVHWTKEGSKRLAGYVRDAIRLELALRPGSDLKSK